MTDLVGYTAVLEKNELKGRTLYNQYHELLDRVLRLYKGTELNDLGDGNLVTFESVLDAVYSAIDLQKGSREKPIVPIRIGLHIGDIFFERGKPISPAINIASRILSLGGANTILLSKKVYDEIKNQPELKADSYGMFDFKNVGEQIEVYALRQKGLSMPNKNEMYKFGKLKETQSGRIASKIQSDQRLINAIPSSMGQNLNNLGSDYPVFQFGGLKKFSYISLITSWSRYQNEFRYENIHVDLVNQDYKVPEEFIENLKLKSIQEQNDINSNVYESKVRLISFKTKINAGLSNDLFFKFCKILYRDFLVTNLALDEKIPASIITFRDKFFPRGYEYHPESGSLSNLCGVGVFIISSDDKIIIAETSSDVIVNPNVYGYSAGGSMDWNDTFLHPFKEMMRECKEEIKHEINEKNLRLLSFGLDAQKGYYQFSFYEKTRLNSLEIIDNSNFADDRPYEVHNLIAIDYDYKRIIDSIITDKWDTVASAILIILCINRFGKSLIEEYLMSL